MMPRSDALLPKLLLAIAIAAVAGCSNYTELSPTAYEYAKALYSIANLKASDRLDSVREQIEADQAAGQLSSKEMQWLTDIIDSAEEGDWESASGDARKMISDQVSSP